jgi:hypothetical protein
MGIRSDISRRHMLALSAATGTLENARKKEKRREAMDLRCRHFPLMFMLAAAVVTAAFKAIRWSSIP